MEVAAAFVSIAPSMRGFGSKLDREVSGETRGVGKRLGSGFGKAFVAGGSLIAAAGIGKFLKDSIGEARESQKVAAQTGAVIKSTGGVANVTAKSMDRLASSISRKSGIDDEAIASAGNMLLTFTNVRNEAGKGNKVFDQTVRAATDMSVALGTDGKAAAMQLGKALNDPVKGLTKLQRSGVTFTEQQKKQVEAMVKSGNTLGAQKLILREVNKEFGGSAAAQATAGDKFKVAFGNLQESIGNALLPVLDKALGGLTKFAVYLTNNVGPGIRAVNGFLAPVIAGIGSFFSSLKSGGGAGSGFLSSLKSIGSSISANFLPVLKAVGALFTTSVLPPLKQFGTYLATSLGPIFTKLGGILSTQVIPLIASIAKWLASVWYPAVLKVYASIATQLKPILDALFKTIQTSVLPAVQRLLTKFKEWQPTIQKVLLIVLKVIGVVLRLAATILAKVLPPLIRFAGFLIENVVMAGIAMVGAIVKIVAAIIKIGSAIGKAIAWFKRFADGVDSNIRAALRFIASVPGKIKGVFSGAGSMLLNIGKQIIQGLINGITSVGRKIGDVVRGIVDKIPAFIRKRMGIASPSKVTTRLGEHIGQGLINGLRNREKGLRRQIDAVVSRLQGLRKTAQDFAAGIADKFRGDMFTGGLEELRKSLYTDLFNAQAFTTAIQAAAKKGLSGGLLKSISESGNVKVAQEIAGLSRADIQKYENLFNARENAAKVAGNVSAGAIWDKAWNAQQAELRGLRADLKAILRRERQIIVNDRSGNPRRTAREVARREALAGGH
jgi:hypothetical protein